ncbi:MAG: hypothetical protein CO093_06520 [Alphaproteobacteria bacterium CG_4_9_14_3_um_filter_47_13]|nr:MAG: hypothetical protein CO093_06520 [Alphaproteobacteria bacterium CG_4_9_14_3_um_filter_47_13]
MHPACLWLWPVMLMFFLSVMGIGQCFFDGLYQVFEPFYAFGKIFQIFHGNCGALSMALDNTFSQLSQIIPFCIVTFAFKFFPGIKQGICTLPLCFFIGRASIVECRGAPADNFSFCQGFILFIGKSKKRNVAILFEPLSNDILENFSDDSFMNLLVKLIVGKKAVGFLNKERGGRFDF